MSTIDIALTQSQIANLRRMDKAGRDLIDSAMSRSSEGKTIRFTDKSSGNVIVSLYHPAQ